MPESAAWSASTAGSTASWDRAMPRAIPRAAYAAMFGPTTGDRLRLADTELIIEIESDRTIYGEEVKFGGGKVIRDGMGQGQATRADGAVDTVITNAVILDYWGVVKADIGIRDGRISGIGKAGNPDIQPGVDIVIGPGTEAIAGEGRIVTAGGIDSHIHFICPQLVEEALYSGITTMLGGGTGPAAGTAATTCTPGPWHLGPDTAGSGRAAGQSRLLRQRQCFGPARAGRDGRGRRLRIETSRGLGNDPGGNRHLPRRRRAIGHCGRDPYRHAQRVRVLSRTRSPRSRAATSTPFIPKGQGAATPPTSSNYAGCRTCCPRRPTRPARSRSTPSTSISTC